MTSMLFSEFPVLYTNAYVYSCTPIKMYGLVYGTGNSENQNTK